MSTLSWQKDKALIASVALAAALAGCVALGKVELYESRPIRFSHVTHGKKNALSCENCHSTAVTATEAGMPTPRSCSLCHKDREHFEKYLKPFLVEGKVTWTSITKLDKERKFSHQAHAAKGVQCAACHDGIGDSAEVSTALKVSKKQCLECHAEQKVSSRCDTCHLEINEQTKPQTHGLGWDRFHGQASRSELMLSSANDCSQCHTEASCDQCHQAHEPRDHTTNFRQRSHGLIAAFDRDRCVTCHSSDSCESCHSQTAPRDHRGSFGSPRNSHCGSCHFPVSGEQRCFACHKGLPSHERTPTPPAFHSPGMNCRQCHFPGQRLQHLDIGVDCVSCHKL